MKEKVPPLMPEQSDRRDSPTCSLYIVCYKKYKYRHKLILAFGASLSCN